MLPDEVRQRILVMKPEIKRAILKVDTESWKKVPLEFGDGFLELSVPPDSAILSMKDVPVLAVVGGALLVGGQAVDLLDYWGVVVIAVGVFVLWRAWAGARSRV